MSKEINHISGSFLNSYDNYRDDFINSYILGIKTPENIYMKFGKDYEDCLAENEYKDYLRQEKLDEVFEWYKIVWYYDFVNDNEIIEVKTKSGWWSKNEIKKNWQFRLYNHYRKWKTFKIHQYNKKRQETKIWDIWREDEYFVPELYVKIKEIEEFLQPYDVRIMKDKI